MSSVRSMSGVDRERYGYGPARLYELRGLNVDQRFVILAATALIGIMILGAGALYFVLVLEGREVPAGVSLLLGVAMGNIANVILGKKSFETANTLQDVSAEVSARQDRNKEKVDALIEELERLHPEAKGEVKKHE